MINLIAWLMVVGLIGWVGSLFMRERRSLLHNIIVGAFVASLVLMPLLGTNTLNEGNFSLLALLAVLLGISILVAAANVFQRGWTHG